MAAQKASVRRAILQEAQKVLNQMIALNEQVLQQDTVLKKSSLTAGDLTDSCNAMLTGLGPATTTDGTGSTMADKLVGILNGSVTITVNDVASALSGTHLTE
jgi:hypothetical protein